MGFGRKKVTQNFFYFPFKQRENDNNFIYYRAKLIYSRIGAVGAVPILKN